jgi:antitoxin component of MazEF toxin-antitoxin module
MGYITKIQKVERPTNKSFYVNLPSAVAQALEIEKGELFEWIIENKNLLLLKRMKKLKRLNSKKGRV